MDLKDAQILFALDKNARATFVQIGKLTRLKSETVRYRVQSLIKQNVIFYFLTVINRLKLGDSIYQIMLKLQNTNEIKKQKIISYLKENNRICWIGNLEGKYDLAFIFVAKNQVELQKLTNDFFEKFSPFIMKKTFSMNLSGEFLSRDYLINTPRNPARIPDYRVEAPIITLDEINLKLCKLLASDARCSVVELGNKIGISADAIMMRIKKLRNEGIITRHIVVLNQEAIQQAQYKLLIYLNDRSLAQVRALVDFSRTNNRVCAIMKSLGEWDYEIDLEVQNVQQLREFTLELTERFSNNIRDYETLRIVSIPKFTFFP